MIAFLLSLLVSFQALGLMSLWARDGVLIKNAEGNLVNCDHCPCSADNCVTGQCCSPDELFVKITFDLTLYDVYPTVVTTSHVEIEFTLPKVTGGSFAFWNPDRPCGYGNTDWDSVVEDPDFPDDPETPENEAAPLFLDPWDPAGYDPLLEWNGLYFWLDCAVGCPGPSVTPSDPHYCVIGIGPFITNTANNQYWPWSSNEERYGWNGASYDPVSFTYTFEIADTNSPAMMALLRDPDTLEWVDPFSAFFPGVDPMSLSGDANVGAQIKIEVWE